MCVIAAAYMWLHAVDCRIQSGQGHLICVCVCVCVHLSCRSGAFQAVPPVGEDLAASYQTSQCCAGPQVQPQEQTRSSTLPLPETQTCGLLCPHSAGQSTFCYFLNHKITLVTGAIDSLWSSIIFCACNCFAADVLCHTGSV